MLTRRPEKDMVEGFALVQVGEGPIRWGNLLASPAVKRMEEQRRIGRKSREKRRRRRRMCLGYILVDTAARLTRTPPRNNAALRILHAPSDFQTRSSTARALLAIIPHGSRRQSVAARPVDPKRPLPAMATPDGAFGFIVRDESLLALAVYAGTG